MLEISKLLFLVLINKCSLLLINAGTKMLQMKSTFIVLLSLILFGCNEQSDATVGDTAQVDLALKEALLVGVWQPSSNENLSFEFLSSVEKGTRDNSLKTGRTYKNGILRDLFYWNLQSNGIVTLNIVSKNCNSRPISWCEVLNKTAIQSSGSQLDNLSWEISSDTNADNIVNDVLTEKYQKKVIDFTSITQGDFYLTTFESNFSHAIPAQINSTSVALSLDYLGTPIVVTGEVSNEENYQVTLTSDQKLTSTKNFYVQDVGYQDFTIKSYFENIILTSSIGNNFTVSYDIVREVVYPAGMDASTVQLDDLVALDKRTRYYSVVDSFIAVPEILSSDKFYSYIVDQFSYSKANGGGSNEIVFDTASTGVLNYKDLYQDKYSEEKPFSWRITDSNFLELAMDDGFIITVKFIEQTLGGYIALLAYQPPGDVDPYFTKHEFLFDDSYPAFTDAFPGRFEFMSDDGFSKIFIDFKADHTLETNAPGVGGYWHLDENDNLISYECSTLNNKDIEDYQSCYESLGEVKTDDRYTNFSHIRVARILHREGNDFKVKYNANVWGGPFGIVDSDYLGISWTYHWKRIGDVN